MRLDGLEAAIFDFDGLMIDSEPVALEIWQQVLAPYGARLSPEDYRAVIGKDPETVAGHVLRVVGDAVSVERILKSYWELRTEIMGRRVSPNPGLQPLIDGFRREGLRLGVASNSHVGYVHRTMEQLGLLEAFDCVVGRDEVARGKPHPDVYLEAAKRLGAAPARCLAIEDSPTGLQAACAAGMDCIVIPNPDLRDADFSAAWATYDSLVDLARDLGRDGRAGQ